MTRKSSKTTRSELSPQGEISLELGLSCNFKAMTHSLPFFHGYGWRAKLWWAVEMRLRKIRDVDSLRIPLNRVILESMQKEWW